jgi:ABC-type transporter Mla MlaB component
MKAIYSSETSADFHLHGILSRKTELFIAATLNATNKTADFVVNSTNSVVHADSSGNDSP